MNESFPGMRDEAPRVFVPAAYRRVGRRGVAQARARLAAIQRREQEKSQ